MVRLAFEQFCKKNTNCSIEDSLKRIKDVVQCALERDIAVRGYVSCVVGCPYQVFIADIQSLSVTSCIKSWYTTFQHAQALLSCAYGNYHCYVNMLLQLEGTLSA